MSVRRLTLLLVGILYFAYLLSFSGSVKSDDERFIIDTVDSFAIRHSLLLNQTTYLRGLQTTDVEPAQPVLAVPLYWIAYHIPWIGNTHALYLFNLLVTALTGGLFFLYALELGYSEKTAAIGTLLFGLTTIVWPYTQTFFREPLTMLSLLLAAFCTERWRRAFIEGHILRWAWLAASLGTIALALLSKEAALIALPALLALAYPGWRALLAWRREVLVSVIVIAIFTLVFVGGLLFYREGFEALTGRYQVFPRLQRFLVPWSHAYPGIAGFLISPGRSVWMYSPVLMLALGASLVLPRKRWRESWLPLVLLGLFVVTYATMRGTTWYGGASWGPRYMVPLTPFLMIGALAAIDRALTDSGVWLRVLVIFLALLGLAIQVGGVYVNLYDYYSYVQSTTGDAAWSGRPMWDPRWSQALGSLLYMPQARSDVLWLTMGPDWVSLGVILASLVALVAALILSFSSRLTRVIHLLPIVLVPSITLLVLYRAYPDPRFRGDYQALHMLRCYIEANALPEDRVVLSTPSYVDFFLNYYKGQTTWYSLPASPGERYSFEQQVPMSDSPDDIVSAQLPSLTGRFSNQGDILWMVGDTSPYLPWSTRSPEWYLARHFYEMDIHDFDTRAWLTRFLLTPAPLSDQSPAYHVGAHLGDSIQLVGWDTIDGQTIARPGGPWGLSLLWQALAPVEADYTVGVYLIDQEGQLTLQSDRWPQGGFEPTSDWVPGERIRDNFGFVLPADMQPGEYAVWVALYSWPSLERLPVRGPDGTGWEDYVSLTTLTVAP